jgi:ATP-dependent Clp protease protease subunit
VPKENQLKNQSQSKFWNFVQNSQEGEEVELRISGEIISDDDAWIYEWFGIAASSPNAFRDELAKHKGKNIKVWIDSFGGDVFAGAGIYNALKSHDGKVTTIVDGKAMSAASVIAMAGEEIHMSPVGIMMIHNPLTRAWGEAKDMRHAADVLDEVKETIINAYQMKTGKPRNKISEMMDEETYMSAKKALNDGFADKILYSDKGDEPVENNFSFSHMTIKNSMDESMKKFFEVVTNKNLSTKPGSENIPQPDLSNNNPKGEEGMEIKNAQDLKTQLPAIYDEVFNAGKLDGVKAEQARLKAFDVLNGKVDSEFLQKEKYENNSTAQDVLFRATVEGKTVNTAYLQNTLQDAANANEVPGESSDPKNADEAAGILNFVQKVANKTLGREVR